jgi:hypothetical protein
MPWSYTFLAQIALKDGQTISTLTQARAMIVELPPFRRQTPIGDAQPNLSLMQAATATKALSAKHTPRCYSRLRRRG